MAAYASRTDLTKWGCPAAALEGVATGDQDDALEAASRLIDSYLLNHYTLPLSNVGKDIIRACAAIAAYDLIVTRGFSPQAGSDMHYRARYEDQLSWLRAVGKGQARPTFTDSSLTKTPAGDFTESFQPSQDSATTFVVNGGDDITTRGF